jgi:hypothetical protein
VGILASADKRLTSNTPSLLQLLPLQLPSGEGEGEGDGEGEGALARDERLGIICVFCLCIFDVYMFLNLFRLFKKKPSKNVWINLSLYFSIN